MMSLEVRKRAREEIVYSCFLSLKTGQKHLKPLKGFNWILRLPRVPY